MNKKRTYLVLLLLALLAISCKQDPDARKLPDMRETYSLKDKKPFGSFIAFRQLEEMFTHNTLRVERRSFSESWNHIEDTSSLYICLTRTLYTTDADVSSIMEMANRGNSVFISTSSIDENLAHELGCSIANSLTLSMLMGKPYETTGLKLVKPYFTDTAAYRYFYFAFSRSFASVDSSRSLVLGVNDYGAPDFMVIFHGKGRIYLHCEPRAFSNYFLLQRKNHRYLQELFGYSEGFPEHVYWNDYYSRMRSRSDSDAKKDDKDAFSSLDELLKHPPLAAAFWLAIILLLLYVLFGGKRRQRIIEERKPNENTTLTFTETIGRLYLQKKDNKNIADKMITYFNEYIRNNYYLNTHAVNSDFITTLSRKSGVPRDRIESLYRAIGSLQQSAGVDDFQLLSLNEQIQHFYKTIR